MTSSFSSKPRVCFEIEKVIGVSSEGNVRSYQVQWAPAWISSFHLVGCEHLIQEFLQRQQNAVEEPAQGMPQQQDENKDGKQQVLEPVSESDEIFEQENLQTNLVNKNNNNDAGHDLRTQQSNASDEHGNETFNTEPLSHPIPNTPNIQLEELNTPVIKIEDEDGDDDDTNIHSDPHLMYSEEGVSVSQNNEQFDSIDNFTVSFVAKDHSPLTLKSHKRTQNNETSVQSYDNTHSMDYELEDGFNEQLQYFNEDISNKKHKCEVCNKCFPSASNLRIHTRTHTGHRPYTCEHCQRGFTQSGDLRRHLRMHEGVKPFVCDLCGKGFTRKHTMNNHRLSCASKIAELNY